MNSKTHSFLLGAEFVALFLIGPLIMATLLPPTSILDGLFVMTGVGMTLLILTPGFRMVDLLSGAGSMAWGFIALFLIATAVSSFLLVQLTAPGALFAIPRSDPRLILMIAVFYPLVSALPQELIYRVLFFQRYAAILPTAPSGAIVLNAALFSFAHLMYWSWIVAVMTFCGGLAFAYAYRVRGNFPEALLLHAASGVIVFAVGLGIYFYSGNVVRPF